MDRSRRPKSPPLRPRLAAALAASASLAFAPRAVAEGPALPAAAPAQGAAAETAAPPPPANRDGPIFRTLVVEAVTDFPVDIAARAALELPYRLRASASVGVLPGPYVDAFNDFAVAVGAYPQSEADAIRAALQQSLILRLHAGWRPFAEHGFYVDLGYGLAALGGTETSSSTLIGGTGIPLGGSGGDRYTVNSRLHMLDAELGWEWPLPDRFVLRAALGLAGTIAAHSTVTPDFTPANPQQQEQADQQAAAQLDHIYTSSVFTPVFTLGIGFRIF